MATITCYDCKKEAELFQRLNNKPFCKACVTAGTNCVNSNAMIQDLKSKSKVNLAERFAKVKCPKCKGKKTMTVDFTVRVPMVGGFQINTCTKHIDCDRCDGWGTIIDKGHLKVAEEALSARRSLAQEICEGLKVRGFWAPDDLDSADVINAVFLALEKVKKEANRQQGWGS